MRGGKGGMGRRRGGGGWHQKGKLVLSVSKFKRPLWRAARARTSVMFFFFFFVWGFDFLVFSDGSFKG